MSLEEYRRKRRPGATPEPIPEAPAAPSAGARFVIHKHDATRLHYDLRLEHDGVLMSWAIPKGLPTPHDPRKLAVHVEDHPLEYLEFKGEIPKGEYGAGTVDIWDIGDYEHIEEKAAGKVTARAGHGRGAAGAPDAIARALDDGKLTFHLHGHRVDGEFSLVRMKGRGAKGRGAGSKMTVSEGHGAPGGEADKNWLILLHKKGRLNPDLATEGVAAPMPVTAAPMQAILGDKPFSSPDFLYEIKYDGVRAISFLSADGTLSVKSRNNKELGSRFPELDDIGAHFLAEELVVDGEIVAVDERGVSHFQLLQGRINLDGGQGIEQASRKTPAFYYVFDILFLNGRDLTGLPLERRKEILSSIFIPHGRVRLTESIEAGGEAFFEAAKQNGLEGIIAKSRRSVYSHKRSRDWIKLKAVRQQEFVIGGYTQPQGSRARFGALLVGYYDGGDLVYAGHVGTGFSEQTLDEVYAAMQPLKQKQTSFLELPRANAPAKWVKPQLVAEIKFAEWTREGNLRQPVFLGLRQDKDPKDVIREEPGAARDLEAAGTPGGEASPADAHLNAGTAGAHPAVYLGMPAPRGAKQVVSIAGRRLNLSHLDKIFWPEQGYQKYDLINYYHRVAEFILPHLEGRPLTLKRYPDGFGSKPFFQKEAPAETPDWVRTETIPSPDSPRKKIRYIICDDLPSLYFLANIACISQNPWLSSLPHLDNPDTLVLDIDPPGPDRYDECIEIALLVRKHLAGFGLKGYPKTSGATGIHVYVPIKPVYSYEQARQFGQVVGWLCREERPDLITLDTATAKRHDKIYLDCLQNVRGKTVASVYSVRAQPGAPVSTPLDWDELRPGLRPGDFTIANIPERLEAKGDLFAGVLSEQQDLMLALKRGEKYLQAG